VRRTDGQSFIVELIKPSHYDDDGYVIQWRKAAVPSNTLGCLYGLARDCGERRILGDDVDIVVNAYDETKTVIPIKKIIRRIKASGGGGLICLVGVQSNQFPRAVDMARQFLAAGVQVVVGGFHVSGCLAMLPEMPADIKEAQEMGVALFAGEAEGRFDELFADAYHRRMKPLYNYMSDLPDLQGNPTPFLPVELLRDYVSKIATFDAGRGCPFQCSFCTIINVQGRKSRHRDADDIERIVRANLAQGVISYFITDDNFARNKNWESIFDRIIQLREDEGIELELVIQVDTLCHKIPNFIEKAARAGSTHVFIGLENINPDNLMAANKRQNRITEYRTMFQAWRNVGVISYAGYIIGFPNDTPETVARDIDIIKRELPVDLLEFFVLTPLPGSADHKALYDRGVWMDPDMNNYDVEHMTTAHPLMSKAEWQHAYRTAWDRYYSPDHVETLLRRAAVSNINTMWLMHSIFNFYGAQTYEKVHPLQGGYFRRKLRTQRRGCLPRVNPLIFYPRRLWEIVTTYVPFLMYRVRLNKLRRRIERDPQRMAYTDLALTPVSEAGVDEHRLDLFVATDAAKAAVAKFKPKPEAPQPCIARKIPPRPETPWPAEATLPETFLEPDAPAE
jgi:radical SAM superfamily enzyme YgiQ (UPF0313 family)